MFFVAAGLRFDIGVLTGDGFVLVPLLLTAMVLTRVVPSLIFLRLLPAREVLASALLMSTKLPFVVAAVQIGLARGGLRPETASALITAAIVTVLVLPGAAAWALRSRPVDGPGAVDGASDVPGDLPPDARTTLR